MALRFPSFTTLLARPAPAAAAPQEVPPPPAPVLSTPSFTREDYTPGVVDAEEAKRYQRRKRRIRTVKHLVVHALASSLAVIGAIDGFPLDGVVTLFVVMNFAVANISLLLWLNIGSKRADTTLQDRADQRARDAMVNLLGDDPLSWPAWTLEPTYTLLNDAAQTAARPHLNASQFDVLLTRAGDGGTVGEQVSLVQGLPLPRIERVEVVVPRPRDEVAAELAALRERHHQLSVEYGAYLTDPVEVLRTPLLSDVTDPLTAELVDAYALLTAVPDQGDVDTTTYGALLERAWKAWRAARAHAQKVGLDSLDPSERKRVRRAQRLLAIALDPASTDFERTSAYTQVKKLLEGLVTLPEPAREALVSRVRPALEATA